MQARLRPHHFIRVASDYDFPSPTLSPSASPFRSQSPALSSVSTDTHCSLDISSNFKSKRDSVTSNTTTTTITTNTPQPSHFRLKNQKASIVSPPPSEEQAPKKSKRYKTQICRNWEQFGKCRFGDDCSFAHGEDELQEKKHVRKKYRSQRCVEFQSTMHCPYGPRCQFQHVRFTSKHNVPFSLVVSENTCYLKQRLQILDRNERTEDAYAKLIKKKAQYQNFYASSRLPVFAALAQ